MKKEGGPEAKNNIFDFNEKKEDVDLFSQPISIKSERHEDFHSLRTELSKMHNIEILDEE